jgi:hypothetical protein
VKILDRLSFLVTLQAGQQSQLKTPTRRYKLDRCFAM